MNPLPCRFLSKELAAILCALLLAPGDVAIYAQAEQANGEKKLTMQQLDSLVAPIALYPDPLLAQVLAASTYPIQIVEAQRWLQSNNNLKGEKLVKEAAKQDWEPSIQALVVFPSVLNRMSQNLPWTTSMGNAFLAQQSDVMAAVQQMRRKAHASGALASNPQQRVDVQSVDGSSVIVIQPANPQVIYVPDYNPNSVYGVAPAYYPYPAMAYPSTGAMVAASAISFGAGIALGAAFDDCCGYGGWGWGCNWGSVGSVTVNNDFFGRYGYATGYRRAGYGSGAWEHNPYYRGAVPYSSAALAGRYGAAAGVRTPYGSAATIRTPYGSAGAIRTPYGDAAGVRTPYGDASRYSSADRSMRTASDDWAGSRSFSSGGGWSSAFSGFDRGGGFAHMSSGRGFSSMGGWGGGGFGGGRFGGGGFGRRR